jgi:hypothetical protein
MRRLNNMAVKSWDSKLDVRPKCTQKKCNRKQDIQVRSGNLCAPCWLRLFS